MMTGQQANWRGSQNLRELSDVRVSKHCKCAAVQVRTSGKCSCCYIQSQAHKIPTRKVHMSEMWKLTMRHDHALSHMSNPKFIGRLLKWVQEGNWKKDAGSLREWKLTTVCSTTKQVLLRLIMQEKKGRKMILHTNKVTILPRWTEGHGKATRCSCEDTWVIKHFVEHMLTAEKLANCCNDLLSFPAFSHLP